MCKKNIRLSNLLKSDIALVTIIIAVGIAVLFWQVFIKGKVIVPGDIPYSNPFWHTIEPNRYNPPQNPLLFDQISMLYVWHHIASKSMKTNRSIPLWNPHEFTGQPLLANALSSLFYPPNLLLFWLSPGHIQRDAHEIMRFYHYLKIIYVPQPSVHLFEPLCLSLTGLGSAFFPPWFLKYPALLQTNKPKHSGP